MAAEISSPFSTDMAAPVGPDERYLHFAADSSKRLIVIQRNRGALDSQRYGTIHGAGIDIEVAKSFGQQPRDGTLSCAGRAVNGNRSAPACAAWFLVHSSRGDSFDKLHKVREGCGNAFDVVDGNVSVGGKSGDQHRHGNPVVPEAFEVPAVKPSPAGNLHAVLGLDHIDSRLPQVGSHGRNTVRFLDPQFPRLPYDRAASGERSSNADHRKLVDRPRHHVPADLDAMKG